MSLFDGKPGCKICGKTEGCDCWGSCCRFCGRMICSDLCAANQRIAELEAERDQLKAQLGQVRDLFIEIDTCEDYIHQFEGAENCGLCIPRTAEIWKLLGITP